MKFNLKVNNQVIFNSSKIGWIHIDVAKLIDVFKKDSINSFGVNEIEFLEDYTVISNHKLQEVYRDISLYDVCIYNICNELKIFKNELQIVTHQHIIDKWFSIAKGVIDYLIDVFENNTFSASIIFHGHLVLDACLLELSKRFKVPFLTIEATSNKNRVVWDNVSGKVVTYNLASNYFQKYFHLINSETVYNYSQNFKSNIFLNKRKEHISNELNDDYVDHQPYILYIGQVYNDASQLFSLNNDLNSPTTVIENVVKFSKDLNVKVIIKLHPKEHNGKDPVAKQSYDLITYKRIEYLSSDKVLIDFDNKWNTFDLIKQSQFVVTVNSQAGIEACLFDKPVVSFYKGFYSNQGFTYDFSSIQELKLFMNDLMHNNVTTNRDLNTAKLFYYVFFEKYCVVRSEYELVNKVKEIGNFKNSPFGIWLFQKIKNRLNV